MSLLKSDASQFALKDFAKTVPLFGQITLTIPKTFGLLTNHI